MDEVGKCSRTKRECDSSQKEKAASLLYRSASHFGSEQKLHYFFYAVQLKQKPQNIIFSLSFPPLLTSEKTTWDSAIRAVMQAWLALRLGVEGLQTIRVSPSIGHHFMSHTHTHTQIIHTHPRKQALFPSASNWVAKVCNPASPNPEPPQN